MAKGAYIGVPHMTINPVFADNTWEQIICACRNDEVPDTWSIGDQKAMTIGDRDYLIDIIGKHHDTYADGSGTAPLTLQMHDCYKSTDHMNLSSATTEGGWEGSYMRNSVMPRLFDLMPAEVQSGIKEVVKYTAAGMDSNDIVASNDKLFLLSEVEITGRNRYSKSGEGVQYAYYTDGGETIKHIGSTAASWWTRSPQGKSGFVVIWSGGDATASGASNAYGVALAFCFGGTPILPVARKIKKGYIGVAPKTYRVVEYIESSGTQRIDTGYIPTGENVKVVCKARLTAPLGANTLFGGTLWASPRAYLPSIIGYNNIPLIQCGQAQKGAFYDIKLDTDYVFSLESKDGTFTAMRDDTVVYNGETSGTIAKLSLYLFAQNYENSRVTGFSSARMYYFHAYDNDVLARYYIPCVDDDTGEVGLYDKANDVFYTNAGTGTFIAGAETGEVIQEGVARKIKKAYIGDKNGVAQLCYSTTDYFIPAGADKLVTADNKTFCVR